MGVFRHSDGRFVRRAVLCLLVGIAVLSATTGVATADADITIERNGDTLDVTVTPSNATETNRTAEIFVNGNPVESYNLSSDGADNTTSLQIQEFSDGLGSLAAANVTVQTSNGTTATEFLDLRYLDADGDAYLSDDRSQVVLPVDTNTTVGITPGDSITFNATDGTTSTNVTGSYTDGELLVSISTLQGNVDLFENLTFQSTPAPSYSVTPSAGIDATVATADDAMVISHPLVFEGTRYRVTVTTTNPDGTYSRSTEPAAPGRFELPESVYYAESVSVSIAGPDGDTDYSNDSLSLAPAIERTNGTWFAANGTLVVEDALPENVSTVWIRTDGSVSTVDGDRINASARTVNLSDTGAAPTNNSTALFVGAETLSVDISAQPTNTTTGGAPDQSMSANIISMVTNNISIILTLLLTPLLGLITFKTTQEATSFDPDAVTVGVVSILLGIGGGVWWTEADPLLLISFLLFTIVVAAIQIFVWLELSQKRGLDRLLSVGVGVLVAVPVVGVVAAVKLFVLEQDPQMRAVLSLAGAVYGLLAAGAWTGIVSLEGGTTGGGSAGPPSYDTKIRIEDETGSLVTDRVQVTLTRGQGLDGSQTETITGGSATASLQQGDWTAKATVDGQTVRDRTTVRRAGQRLTLQFSGRTVSLTVVDKETRSKIPNAELLVTVDGEQQRHTPNQNGRWEATYPRSADSLSVTVTHDRYEDVSISRSMADDVNGTVQMTPLKGTLVATVTVDGRGVPDIPVELTPRESALSDGFSGTTNANGEVTFQDARIGAYDAVPTLADKPTEFTADSVSVRISEGQRTREKLPIRFDYALSDTHRRTIRDLRDRASDIATVSRRDGAIQSFYASVVHELLDTVEDIPNQPQPLLVVGIAPDSLVSAMLSAAEKATETVDEVMSSKRNVDLFAACTDLPSASVTWDGPVSMERLLELSEQDIGQQRGELANRVERTDDRIARERSDVAEVRPAQEMLEAVRAMVRDSANVSQVDSAALVVTAEALLDAIESLFTRTQLRERMERTVY